VAAPKLTLTQVFAIVVADVFLTVAPLLPGFVGTIPSVLIKPAATAVGIGMICNLLFFPQSTSHLVLEDMEKVLMPMRNFIDACLISLQRPLEELSLERLEQTKAEIFGGYKGLEASMGFLKFDFSIGRWNSEDVETLRDPLRQLVIMFQGLLQLQLDRVQTRSKGRKLQEIEESMQNDKTEDKGDVPGSARHQLISHMNLRKQIHTSEVEELLSKSLQALFSSSGPLLNACGDAVDAVQEALHEVNAQRWFSRPSAEEFDRQRAKHEDVLIRIKDARTESAALTAQHLLDPHIHLFDDRGNLMKATGTVASPLHGLVIGLIFEERILGLAGALETMLSQLLLLEQHRTKICLWAPTWIRHSAAWIFGRSPTPALNAAGEVLQIDEDTEIKDSRKMKMKKKKASEVHEQLESLRYHGGRKRNPIGQCILAIIHFLGNTEGLYALRVLIVTIAMGVPAVLTTSAGFYYREKGLWVLIIAQTGLVTCTADFVYGFGMRVLGTVAGGVLGLVCWYIGAGTGPGNTYGMSAIMAVMIVCLMWGRLFAPPALLQAFIVMAATVYMVVAFSWVDT
jgi:Putative ER transporter, 6TM, N-terminal